LKPEEAFSQTQPIERQAFGCDRLDHAPAARGRPAGHVLAQEKWEVVRLSVIAEEDES
jgi:hypothetical protein